MSIRCTGPARQERVTAHRYEPLRVVHPPRAQQPVDGSVEMVAYLLILLGLAVLFVAAWSLL
jgi:hypothetical protein